MLELAVAREPGSGEAGEGDALLPSCEQGRWRELARVAEKSAGGFRLTSRRVHPYLAPPSPPQLPPPFFLRSSFPADAHRHRRAGKRRIFIGRRSTASALLHRPALIFHDRPPSSSSCSHGLCEFNPPFSLFLLARSELQLGFDLDAWLISGLICELIWLIAMLRLQFVVGLDVQACGRLD